MDRTAFLARIRSRLAGADGPALPVALPRTFGSGEPDTAAGTQFERFAAALSTVGGEARLVDPDGLEEAVREAAGDADSAVLADDLGGFLEPLSRGLRAAGCSIEAFRREAAARAAIGVTSAVAAVASTGSLLIASPDGSARVASLLPPKHLAVVPAAVLVAGFEDLYALMPTVLADHEGAVLVTGPSRTADIEMQVVRGVHGPGALTVLVVADAP